MRPVGRPGAGERLPAEISPVPQTLGEGHVRIDPSTVPGVAGHVGLVMVTPVVKDGDDRLPVVLDFPLLGAFTLANTALGSGFGRNPLGRLAIERSTGARADPGKTVGGTGASVVYQQIAPDVIQLVVATSSGS